MTDERAEYLRAVEQRFIALRGRGFMLSPRDVALVAPLERAQLRLRPEGEGRRGAADDALARALRAALLCGKCGRCATAGFAGGGALH